MEKPTYNKIKFWLGVIVLAAIFAVFSYIIYKAVFRGA
jgi:uncharacterized membrane protein (DUF106 family)